MSALIYIHGFLSSPQSHKAVQTGAWLAREHTEVAFVAPALTPYPGQTRQQLDALISRLGQQPIYLMGSSMGGFWATYLAEQYDLPAVLINPACEPMRLMPGYLHQTLHNYHTPDSYRLDESHLAELQDADTNGIRRPANYWVMVQTGDETLDYRKALEKYAGCRQLVEEGGDHGFQNFEQHLPECWAFYQNFYQG
ncbi:YqiA/YcfP family alpha/beta fold hydrolase [Halioxenophilus sp. WMMB6]|uniref:YqiA/YcfP family alpha/beta fold hydrolase n=1 Tax=Halioxenophilus sp. WMMB6 TaxID=3073815 RepID=UPI00295EB942|nr:YqiA/YcfP family alpha/beta fold hydrolase [Halioxenophilus sp. WMMB6]